MMRLIPKMSLVLVATVSQFAFAGDFGRPDADIQTMPELRRLNSEHRIYEIVYPKPEKAPKVGDIKTEETSEEQGPTLKLIPNQYVYITPSYLMPRFRHSIINEDPAKNVSTTFRLDGSAEMAGATLREVVSEEQAAINAAMTPARLKSLNGNGDADERSSPFLDQQIIQVTGHTMLSFENSRAGAEYIKGFGNENGERDEEGEIAFQEFSALINKIQKEALLTGEPTYLWLKMSTEEFPKTREVEEILVIKGGLPNKKDMYRQKKSYDYKYKNLDSIKKLELFDDLLPRGESLERRDSFESSTSVLREMESMRDMKILPRSFRQLRETLRERGLDLEEFLETPKGRKLLESLDPINSADK